MKKLNDKSLLSAWIRAAISDLEACERDPTYVIDMDKWHRPINDKFCRICLAGAVMAQSLGVPPTRWAGPVDTEHSNSLLALNSIRSGALVHALERHLLARVDQYPVDSDDLPPALLARIEADKMKYVNVPHHDDDPEKFKAKIREIANYLESIDQ